MKSIAAQQQELLQSGKKTETEIRQALADLSVMIDDWNYGRNQVREATSVKTLRALKSKHKRLQKALEQMIQNKGEKAQ